LRKAKKAVKYALFSLHQPEYTKRKGRGKDAKKSFVSRKGSLLFASLPGAEGRKHSGGRDAKTPGWSWLGVGAMPEMPSAGAGYRSPRCACTREKKRRVSFN
jgi:hypothetical protein